MSEFLQAKVIESVVQQRFGDLSLRIFRLLRMKKQLEQKGVRVLDPTVGVEPCLLSTVARNTCTRQIADLALIPVSETREYLYKMLSCEFVHLQEVPRTADHAPARTFYLWSVRMEHIKRHVRALLVVCGVWCVPWCVRPPACADDFWLLVGRW